MWLLQGVGPVDGRQVQDAALGPAGQQAEQVTEVALGLELVQAAGLSVAEERAHLGLQFGQVGEGLVFEVGHRYWEIGPSGHLVIVD